MRARAVYAGIIRTNVLVIAAVSRTIRTRIFINYAGAQPDTPIRQIGRTLTCTTAGIQAQLVAGAVLRAAGLANALITTVIDRTPIPIITNLRVKLICAGPILTIIIGSWVTIIAFTIEPTSGARGLIGHAFL